jgi:hypothetical protein
MRVAFDSRPASDPSGIGRYARCLLAALRATPRGELIESREPRGCDVFHAPWIEGAPLRSPVPTVVTLHDLVPLKRPGDYLRSGLRFKLRYLAVQRATRVIVPTRAVGEDAIAAIYTGAHALVFPSDDEGFGLPPLEALAASGHSGARTPNGGIARRTGVASRRRRA